MPGECSFYELWIKEFNWIKKVPGRLDLARCSFCMKDLDIKNMGVGALRSQACYLDEEKEKEIGSGKKIERETLEKNLNELNKRKKGLLNDVEELEESADIQTKLSEQKRKLSFVIQSNALRDAMKLKKRLIAETELEIEDLRKKIKKEY